MMTTLSSVESQWAIVLADDHEAQSATSREPGGVPIQYRSPDEGMPLLQRALRRAISVAPASQILITALHEHREYWQPLAWFVRAAHRFLCGHRSALPLCTASAILRIAEHSPWATVTVLPARCYVAHEWILKSALIRALAELPNTREGIITLGMRDIEESLDEDFLIVSRSSEDRGLRVDGYVRRPVPWVAAHVKREGALVASGILVGYANAFASYIFRVWPELSSKLRQLTSSSVRNGLECELSAELLHHSALRFRALSWRPPLLPQRVLAVSRSGWNGLKTPRATARLAEFQASLIPDSPDRSAALHYFAELAAANTAIIGADAAGSTKR